MPSTVDITDLDAVERAVKDAVIGLGGLDAVANVAGIGDFSGDITETSPDEWNRVIGVNLTGMYHVSRAAIPHLRAAGGGAIVNISSQFGLVGCLASPAYCASKAGVVGLTKAMAIDHAGDGIRVNCVCPGPVDTPMLWGTSATPELTERERARTAHRNLIGRSARPQEIAATIAFILSDDAGVDDRQRCHRRRRLDGGLTRAEGRYSPSCPSPSQRPSTTTWSPRASTCAIRPGTSIPS